MSLVVDCSVAVAWYLPDETSGFAGKVLDLVTSEGASAPFLFPVEFANSLIVAERRRRVPEGFHRRAFTELDSLQLHVDDEGREHVWTTTSQLAHRYGLTVYDAAYLELAQRLRLPLATFDKAMASAAQAAGVALSNQDPI